MKNALPLPVSNSIFISSSILVRKSATYWTVLQQYFNPEMVVVGGGGLFAFEFFFSVSTGENI